MTFIPATAAQAIRVAEILLCCGIAISAAEHLTLGRHFEAGGIYAPAPEFSGRSFVWVILSKAAFLTLASVRLALAVLLLSGLTVGGVRTAELFLLAITGFMIYTRMPAGLEGSEQMTMIVLLGIALGSFFPGNDFVENCCVWFLGMQAALAYATAGLAKMKSPSWRSGRFLSGMLETEFYGSPALSRIFADAIRAKLACRSIMTFESLFPLALLDPRLAAVFVVGGALFHVVNAFAMGLNSFIWPFLATYPAILYCSRSWHY